MDLTVYCEQNLSFSLLPLLANTALFPPPSVFLGKIKEAFDRDAELQNLLLDTFFSNAVQDCQVWGRRKWPKTNLQYPHWQRHTKQVISSFTKEGVNSTAPLVDFICLRNWSLLISFYIVLLKKGHSGFIYCLYTIQTIFWDYSKVLG